MGIEGGSEYFRTLLSDKPFLKERFDSYEAKEAYMERKRTEIRESMRVFGEHQKEMSRMHSVGRTAYQAIGCQVVGNMIEGEVISGKLAGHTGPPKHFPNVLSDMIIIESDSIPQSVIPIRDISILQLVETNVQTQKEPTTS